MSQLVLGAAPPPPRACSWCLVAPATTKVVATDACADCAATTANERVHRWLRAVGAGRR